MLKGATSRVTTLPAPTSAPSPMVTPGSSVEFAPIRALRQMRTPCSVSLARAAVG